MTAPVDREEIARAARLLFPAGAVVELRALGPGGVHSGYFDDPAVLTDRAAAIATLNDVSGVYCTLNEVNPALLSRRANRVVMRVGRSDPTTADADIVRRRWLPVDLDPVRPAGVSSSEAEHEAALARAEEIGTWLSGKGFPAPLIADSGNGAHLLYRIDLGNDADAAELVKGVLATLDALFSDEAVTVDTANFNAARIWKCYGTPAKKGDDTTDRPHRTARLLSVPDECEVIDTATLRRVAGLLPREAPTAPAKSGKNGRKQTPAIDLGDWLREHGIAVRSAKPWQGGTLFVLAECPFSAAHADGAFAVQFGNGAIFAGCHHASCGGGVQRWGELRERFEGKKTRKSTGRTTVVTGPAETKPAEEADPPPASATCTPAQEHRKRACEVLESGDPLGFFMDCFHRDHVGDATVAECLIMSVASQSVANTRGLHVAISGNSGKGKTHACNAMLRLLPEAYRLKGTVSNKALFYYDDFRPGTVLLFDDITLSDDLQELLKSATANFQEPIEHRTLTRDRQLKVCTIPERCVWWLAKVEAVGDDQVMNRMLTVWIDDSTAQDQRVLAHLKRVEAGAVSPAAADPDVLVCRSMWEMLKGAVRTVRIPYARRINFSAAHNRRNPAMLFDLIKCHAVLHFLQRKVGEDGAIVATMEDFTYARKLFLALNGDVGGQETKLTRNESAALTTMSRLGLRVFTIRQLQDSLGLSYHQTYRLLHGYSNSHASYLGILDKCPAISLIDATVVEDIEGTEAKRRQHYFSFDLVQYLEWAARTDVWLDGGEDGEEESDSDDGNDPGPGGKDCTVAPDLHQKTGDCANVADGRNSRCFGREEEREERRTESRGRLHYFPETLGTPTGPAPVCGSVCDPGASATLPELRAEQTPFYNSKPQARDSWCKTRCKDNEPGATVQQSTAKQASPGTTLPLPGVLDHRHFRRKKVSLGRCDCCGEGTAVYYSGEYVMNICEGCYARLVREWNRGEGVV
ncbi:hypothetical protein AZH53_09845 [Methanomicrobiaceae archaeon CYW5]|uniref:hypothetical protein n=1 Tax=Methanovulcanius yangii TaxID=1789227 RepID=UPI0029C9EA8A|nr:hypothetical protein [Methanovulcanius yangii]MBT8508706.1 hypothetical protein [Methanovulcanius yangii]